MKTGRVNYRTFFSVYLAAAWILAGNIAGAESVVLEQTVNGYTGFEDTSIFSENEFSGGGTDGLFAGTNGQFDDRRALIRADLSAIPPGAIISDVSLTLTVRMSGNNNGDLDYTLHRVSADWGEGDVVGLSEGGFGALADTGDATWQSAFHNEMAWAMAGGDFEGTASATATAGFPGTTVTWSSSEMADDVQGWVDGPETNYGWLIRSTMEGQFKLVKKFHSSESGVGRPVLSITYFPPLDESLPAVLPSSIAVLILMLIAAAALTLKLRQDV